ncbi:unnamed protein product [Adineta steineri]|uniref:Uncharacterized protein n=1 Tax=Adineta steineri TaxID=433720 RepID=A0A814L539_9BILA|nr:unnamed protein product [Adineta steineri]CAF1126363.1 unnamed protein product [Adineta steineri]
MRNSRVKNLHRHYTPLGYPPQANNNVLVMTDEERRILNFGPKFVPSNPKQALHRLSKEISTLKDKVGEAWRRETRTIGKYFDKLKLNPQDAELPHLYYNPKDHKLGEPLRRVHAGNELQNNSNFQ